MAEDIVINGTTYPGVDSVALMTSDGRVIVFGSVKTVNGLGPDANGNVNVSVSEAEKAEIVQMVIEALGGQPVAGYFDENNDIVLTSTLPDGTYTFRIEEDGGMYELGTLTKKTTINKYTVTFVADGVTVATVEYEEGATSITEPTVPAKDGYTGAWESYTLNNSNITVNAVYTEVVVEPSYTNRLDGVTIISGKKMSSSKGTESDQSDACATDFIKIPADKVGEVLRIYNVSLHASDSVNNVVFYDENMTYLTGWKGVAGAFSSNVKVSGGVYSLTPSAANANTGYIRFSCGNIDENSIVTIGEEISNG